MLIWWLFSFAVTAAVASYFYMKQQFKFWRNHGVPTLKQPPIFPFGNSKDMVLGTEGFETFFLHKYQEAKAEGLKHVGFYLFSSKGYMPIDPTAISTVLRTDFRHFMNRGIYMDEEDDPLQGHLFLQENEKWHRLRVKLTPTFTSGKMKMMFSILEKVSHEFQKCLLEKDDISKIDIKEWLSRFTTDIIASVAFGIDADSLSNPNADFRKYGRKIFRNSFKDRINIMLPMFLPPFVLKLMKYRITPPDVEEFFTRMIAGTVEYREKNKVQRPDFMQLLIDLKNNPNKEEGLNFQELAAQAFVFYIGGFETSSTLMTFALYSLSKNKEYQRKLRAEIMDNVGQLTYDVIMHKMPYLDQVIDETLRMYPPFPVMPRMCNGDSEIFGGKIPKGSTVAIPILGVHMDPEYYPNPEVFDPEHFSPENKAKRPACTFLPFGEGPRMCIGMRFGLLQSKIGLISILQKFDVSLSDEKQRNLKLKKNGMATAFEETLWLNLKRIE